MKNLFLFSVFVLLSQLSFSQDIIYKKDGTEIQAKIIEITTETIKYKNYSQLEGPTRNILISDVFMLIYEDGSREVFKSNSETKTNVETENPILENEIEETEPELNSTEKCFRGQNDADMYHGKKGSHVALGVAFGGFAVLGAALAEPTPEKGLSTPMMSENKELFMDQSYRSCYIKEARKNNVSSAAIGWGSWILILLAIGAL
jgi:hypothetical protein